MRASLAQPAAIPTRSHKLPVVAIVGRPNVGKSTLFNRLIGERRAIVDDLPGVTRDRNYVAAVWADRRYILVDTGGLDVAEDGPLEASIQAQSRRAMAEADVIIFLFDGKDGLSPLDAETVNLLRVSNKPVLFAVNKLDSQRRAENLYEFYTLGLDHLYSISAEHGLGISDLLDGVVEHFPPLASADFEEGKQIAEQAAQPLRVAIVGRPNVGKSTLVNRLLGYERSVVDSKPGTTRDSLDTPFELAGELSVLVDTAGIRRKSRIDAPIERFSVGRSLRAIERGDLVIHVIDGPEGVTDQDAQLLSYAVQRGKAVVLAVNKWDLVSKSGGDPEKYRLEVRYQLSFLEFAPVAFISAATGYGMRKLLDTAARVVRNYRRKISTSALNQALQQITHAHPAPLSRGRAVKFYYGTQTSTQPPTFALFVNRPAAVPESYKRYLLHHLRESLGFEDSPIRLQLRGRREEKTEKKRKSGSQQHK